jgi:putative ABC transport system substrate-binding protein
MPAKKVALFIWDEEARYISSRNSFIDQLKREGFKAPGITFTIEVANGNKVTAAKIARRLSQEKPDLIATFGTSATLAVGKEIADIPIIFAQVYNPVESKIAKSWESSGNNMTGASAMVPMARLLEIATRLKPIQELGVIYTPGELNSEAQRRALEAVQKDFHIHVLPILLNSKEEIPQIMPFAIQKTDVLYLSGSGVAVQAASAIAAAAAQNKIVTITHIDDSVTAGILLGVCVDADEIGRQAAKKAAAVLRGAAPSSIEISRPRHLKVLLNRKTAQAMHFDVPKPFLQYVTQEIR